jgi:hypothetical protein
MTDGALRPTLRTILPPYAVVTVAYRSRARLTGAVSEAASANSGPGRGQLRR